MGGLCGTMADLVVAAATGGQQAEGVPERKEEDREETWEDEVNMDVFYTDAVKYWEVRKSSKCCKR